MTSSRTAPPDLIRSGHDDHHLFGRVNVPERHRVGGTLGRAPGHPPRAPVRIQDEEQPLVGRTADKSEDDRWHEPIQTAAMTGYQGDTRNQNKQRGYEIGTGVVKEPSESRWLGRYSASGAR